MKKLLTLLVIVISANAYSQVSDLEEKKLELLSKIEILKDSIKYIDKQIALYKSEKILNEVADSTFTARVKEGAKLKEEPSPLANTIYEIPQREKVLLLDYSKGYFKACVSSYCGYLSDVWVIRDDKIKKFITFSISEENKVKKLEKKKKLENEKKRLINLYGQETYNRLEKGYFWIGMNKEMARISLGNPKEINRTVGSFGEHEQWVYDRIYLYFEDGILTSYQD